MAWIFDEGDVIYSNCVGTDVCYHIGIVYKNRKNNKIYVFHNAPTNINKYGGNVVCEKLEDYLKGREIYKVVKTHTKNKDILNVTKKCKDETWDSILFNCEDYVVEIVEGERKSDLRDAWKLGAFSVALLSII